MKRSKFNLSHSYLMAADFGWLYPVLVEDCLPGDTWTARSELYIKAIPLLSPILDKVDVRVDYFFVPNRLLWDGWQKFITGGASGTNQQVCPWFSFNPGESPTSSPNFSGLQRAQFVDKMYQLSFQDQYFDNITNEYIKLSCLPALAYYKIYRDWYYPENVVHDSTDFDEFVGLTNDMVNIDGSLNSAGLALMSECLNYRQRCYPKNRFTGANLDPQRGPEVGFDIPPTDISGGSATAPNGAYVRPGTSTPVETGAAYFIPGGDITNDIYVAKHTHSQNYSQGELGTLTINELRRLNALQRWFEKNARYGARYIEQILSHFGVRTPDYRLDRSEYLGGTVTPVQVSETYQTAAGASDQETEDVLGQYAGHLTSYGVNGMRKYRCDEHGWVIGLVSILPKLSYAQGLQKRFTRFDRLDFAFPEFAQLGEEAIFEREVMVPQGYDSRDPDVVFGYTPRYSDYRHRESRFDSHFLNDFPYWHLGQIYSQDFDDHQNLNLQFLQARDRTGASQFDRIFAYTPPRTTIASHYGSFHFLCQFNHHLRVKRCLPKYVTPSL